MPSRSLLWISKRRTEPARNARFLFLPSNPVYWNVPVNSSTAPLERVTVPVYVPPDTALGVSLLVAPKMTKMGLPAVVAPVRPAAVMVHGAVTAKEVVVPAKVMETLVAVAAAVPVLLRVIWFVPEATLQTAFIAVPPVRKPDARRACAVTETWAVLLCVEKIPKTNPAMATDATNVTATMSTVATIGEMALLPRLRKLDIFIGMKVHDGNINPCGVHV